MASNPDPIDAALARGDVDGAVALAVAALAAGDRDPFVSNLVAWRRVEDGDPVGGEQLVRSALAGAPDDPGLLTTLALALRRQLRFSAALQAVDRAIALAPGYGIAWLERGYTLHQGNSLRLAEASYRQAAIHDPGRAAAFAGVASIAASQGEAAVAREFADRALAIDPHDAVAHCAIARCDTAAGDGAAAAARMQAVLDQPGLTPDNRSAAAALLGDALAKLGETARAMEAYAAAKSDIQLRFPHLARVERQVDIARRLAREVTDSPGAWPAASESGPGHAFLLGFPRSGTTLIETILASVPGVETLEELPTLALAEQKFLLPPGGLTALATAKPADLTGFRSAYWQRVRDFGVGPEARLFVDMDPMKSMDLPLIGRLFGATPIVVMRRDPRDVVLSCFRQNFAASPMALEFISLDRAARFYDAVMVLQRECLARLPNPVLELRYEALVADFDGVTRQLCKFLSLPWSAELRDFGATARRRDVSTASVGQVRRGLFDGGGQWRRFAAEMAPVLPVLAPWVEAFGYSD